MNLIGGALAMICLLFSISACNKNAENTNNSTTTSSSGGEGTSKNAYVNIDTLLMYYKFYEAISADYKEKRAKTEKQLQSRYLKLQDEIANTQKRAQAGLMSQNEIAKAEEDLGLKQQEFQMLQNSLQEGLIAEEQNLMKQLNDKMINYLKKYNADKKYDMIFSYGAGSPILVASEALDITKPVLEGLNAEYEIEVKSKTTESQSAKK
ncbi:MAG: hypothetical protein OHK0038_21510 [Flammeovirgaceae bacterium]